MIIFKENQTKIFIGKHKVAASSYKNYLDLHIIYSIDKKSGYDGKFVRIITFENIYDFEIVKNIKTNNCEDVIENIMYFENGGYIYNKNTF